jgi:5-methylcytosine-specific restriction endonuclease McrA
MSKDAFAAVVAHHDSIYAVQRDLGYKGTSGSITKMLKQRIKQDELKTDHFHPSKRRSAPHGKIPLREILVRNSSYRGQNQVLIKRLLTAYLLKHECAMCKNPPFWNSKKLVLQLDHINGVPDDNRLQNLRILCPNCHSQTSTFSGKGARRPRKPKQEKPCLFCGKRFVFTPGKSGKGRYCSARCAQLAQRKTVWPDASTLKHLIWSVPTSEVAKHFGVTDKAVENWCKIMGVKKPPRGYWSKVRAKNRKESGEGYKE